MNCSAYISDSLMYKVRNRCWTQFCFHKDIHPNWKILDSVWSFSKELSLWNLAYKCSIPELYSAGKRFGSFHGDQLSWLWHPFSYSQFLPKYLYCDSLLIDMCVCQCHFIGFQGWKISEYYLNIKLEKMNFMSRF